VVKKPKVKVEVEKPVFAVVMQTKLPNIDPYRVVIFKKVVNKAITIDGVVYNLVESEQPSVNAQYFRDYCAQRNPKRLTPQERAYQQRERADQRAYQERERLRRLEEEKIKRREANHQERVQGAKRAGIILKEISIMNRKMEEVETGERCL